AAFAGRPGRAVDGYPVAEGALLPLEAAAGLVGVIPLVVPDAVDQQSHESSSPFSFRCLSAAAPRESRDARLRPRPPQATSASRVPASAPAVMVPASTSSGTTPSRASAALPFPVPRPVAGTR